MFNNKVLVSCLVFCGVLLLFYAVAITIIFALQSKVKSIDRPQKIKCETFGCVQAAAQIVSYIDDSIDPCEDFHQFANGLYIKEMTGETEDWDSNNFYSIVNELMNRKLGPLLSEPLHHNEWKAFKLAKTFYQSCLDQSVIVKRGNKQLIDLLSELGGWPVTQRTSKMCQKFDLIKLIRNIRDFGLDTNSIFTLKVGIDPKNTTNRRLEIDRGNYGRNNNENDDEYKGKLYITPTYFIDKNDKIANTTISLEMSRVWKFEEELVNYYMFENTFNNLANSDDEEGMEETDSENKEYQTTTIKKLQILYPYLNWMGYINAILPSGLDVTENEPIMNWNPEFFKKLGGILKTTPNCTLANYIVWRAVYSIYQMETNKIGKKRRDYCIDLTSEKFSIPVTLLYSRKYFNETTREAVVDLVEDVRHAFIDMLRNVTWMDNETRSKAIEKAKNIVAHVGYSSGMFESDVLHEYYEPLGIMESNEFFINSLKWNIFNRYQMFNSLRIPANRSGFGTAINLKPNVANAFYYRNDNTIRFPIAILHEKFFSADRPRYINYASLGNTVGHEITHGFDTNGKDYDLNGNLVTWWNSKILSKFNEKSDCFVQQYSRYTDVKTKLKVNGENTLNENIADNGGIRAAYYAYQNWIERNGPEELVPGIKYNQNQLFWISYAQAEGGVSGELYLKTIINYYSHAPDEFRVNGAVSNIPEFANDFNCPVGKKMNPKEKCIVW